jgi:uncharacterized protein (TIGR03435 family)
MRIVALFCLGTLLAHAQTFDVASIKPSEAPGNAPNVPMFFGMRGGPGSNDPGRITWSHATIKSLLIEAFQVKSYQITGPEWMNSDLFDIAAKVPEGATKEQTRVMLQNLLAERFKMTFHREQKEMATYVLTVGKNGSKLKVSDPEPSKDPSAEPARPPLMARGPRNMGKDGFMELPMGRTGSSIQMQQSKAKLTCVTCPISRLSEMLEQQMNKPITDATGLTGKYDFTLIFEPLSRAIMPGMAAMVARAGGPPAEAPPPPAALEDTAPPLLSAIQDQLGLKLEPKKAPVNIIVIDHMEKIPTEN